MLNNASLEFGEKQKNYIQWQIQMGSKGEVNGEGGGGSSKVKNKPFLFRKGAPVCAFYLVYVYLLFQTKGSENKEKNCLGLYSYPVLMAADILLYK